MSVITSLTATPNRMRIVWDFLASRGTRGIRSEELQRFISPPSLHSSQTQEDGTRRGTAMGAEVVSEMRTLGLIEQSEMGTVRLASQQMSEDEDTFFNVLQYRLLNPIEARQYGQEAFGPALAWFLAQDPIHPLDWGENHRGKIIDDCGIECKAFELTNVARCQQFIYWARYLGFAWRLDIGGTREVVIPDPSPAISRHLHKVLNDGKQRPIRQVLSALASELSVLEGGEVRSDLDGIIATEKQSPLGHLSRSTSFALERIERRGQISLSQPSDADAVVLQLGDRLRPVSHIALNCEE